jgi:DNA replication protein DnaC
MTSAQRTFNDPDGILDGYPDPGPDAAQGEVIPPIPDPVDQLYRFGDPFEIPTTGPTRRERLGIGAGFGTDPMEAAAKLKALNRDPRRDKYQPLTVAEPAPEPDPEQVRLDHLRYLARWCGPTEHARAMVARAEAGIAAFKDAESNAKRKVPDSLHASLAQWQRTLADSEERDEIQATRPPGCHCLGSGGYDGQVALILWEEGAGDRPLEERRIKYSEGADGPMRWSRTCDACPEGRAHLAWIEEELVALEERRQAKQIRRLLGNATIPLKLQHLTLETYPYPAKAARAWRWFATSMAERKAGPPPYSLRPFILFSGSNRRGKTGMAIGILKRAIAQNVPAAFRTCSGLLTELKATYDKDNPRCFSEILEVLQTAPLLVLDDLGAEKLTEYAVEVLVELLDYRANNLLLTIFTTNLSWKRPDGVVGTDDEISPLALWVGQRLYMRIRPNAHLLDFGDIPILDLDVDHAPAQHSQPDDFEDW